MDIARLEKFERSSLVRALLRAVASCTVLLALYYELPIEHRPHQSVLLRLNVALAFFVALTVYELRAIVTHKQPMLRAGVSMATLIPAFLVIFAWVYLTLSHSNPSAFGGVLSRTSSLYFTVTVFSTVGFGDITAKTDPARLVVTFQMLSDLAFVAVVIRLILGAATRGVTLRERADGPAE